MGMKFSFRDGKSEEIRNLGIRSDNGSRFITGVVNNYLSSLSIPNKIIHPATQNEYGHVRAKNHIIERSIMFYKGKRIHSTIKYITLREMHERWLERGERYENLYDNIVSN